MEGRGAAGAPDAAALEQRLREWRGQGQPTLNLACLGLPADFVSLVLRDAPNVAELDLSSNQLTTLPDDLAELQHLRVLRLKYNCLQHLPPVLAALPHLAVLELSGNQITQLDGVVLAQLTALRDLDISSNGLTAVPDSVAALPALETLRLGNNALEALPPELGGCPSLVRLDVSGNRLLALPPTLAQLQKIQRIDCKNNFLPKVPPCLGHLKALKEFDLRYNKLSKTFQQASEKGLARFLAFLRDEEEIERLAEIERNKPVGLQVGPCMAYKCRALTADALASLRAEADGGGAEEFAWIRTGHALCMAGKMVYMFGGSVLKDGGRKTADLFWLSTDRMEWRLQPTKGDKPCPRDGHCMVYDEVRRRLVVFGGRKQNKRRVNDVFFLDLATWTWFQPRTEGAAPSPRSDCSALYHNNQMLIFGGRSSSARLNELHVLDLDAWAWLVPEAAGSAPSPRQGAAITMHEDKLWVHGGRSNFVLDDCYCLDLENGEWSAVPTAGRIMPARYGHTIGHHGSELYLFGGTDALGATVPAMFKLRQASATKYEWTETTFSLPPNKCRSVGFVDGRLNVLQVGHTGFKDKAVPAADLAAGRAVWDVFQYAQLADIKEKEVSPEDLVPKNAKLERIAHSMAQGEAASRLPPSFTSISSRERQLMQRIAQFKESWRAAQATQQQGASAAPLLEPPLVLRNECGTEKVVCTTLRPTSLPHVELHDLSGVVQFVSEFCAYEPLEHSSQPPTHLVSPSTLLEWQAGDSFDLATLECSLLLGAGYNACVAVGYAPKHIALCDQSGLECPYLVGLGIRQQQQQPEAGLLDEEAAAPGEGQAAADGDKTLDEGLGRISEGEEGSALASSRSAAGVSRPATAVATGGNAGAGEGVGEGVGAEAGSRPGTAATQAAAASSEPAESTVPAGSEALAEPVAAADGATLAAVAAEDGSNAEGPDTAAEAPSSASVAEAAGAEAAAATEQQQQPAPVGPPRYLHAFVLVRPGGREITQPLFIDPPTGLQYSPAELPCEGFAFAWNQHNAWANLQRGVQGQLVPGATDWNLSNPNAWEPLLASAVDLSDCLSVSSEFSSATNTASFLRATQSTATLLDQPSSLHGSASRLTPRSTAVTGAGASAAPAALRAAGGGRKSLSLQVAAKNAQGALSNHTPTREFDVGGSLSYLAPSSDEAGPRGSPRTAIARGRLAGFAPETTEMPPSWVPALAVSRERLDVRCPKGFKRTQYRQCQREVFARFGECSRWDGLVERYTLFEDAGCSRVAMTVELFQRRKDRLQRRETVPSQRLVRDIFGPGAGACLRESSVVKGERREICFYPEARADGLLRRVEVLGSSLEEFFVGRPDRLVSRRVRYGPPDLALLGLLGGLNRRGSLMAMRSSVVTPGEGGRKGSVALAGPTITYPIADIKERFSRDPALPRDHDMAKRTFEFEEGRCTTVVAHYDEDEQGMGRLTRAVRVYGEEGELLESSGSAEPPSEEWCRLEWARLAAARKAAEVAARVAEDESQDVAAARLRQEQNVQLVTGHYDAMRTKVEDSDDEPEGPEEDESDYLAPFLPAITGTRDMTPQEAAAVFRNCLQGLKDRATERGLVLEGRRGAEVGEIKWLEGKAATEAGHLSAGEQARLAEQLADARFRLGVLEKRIADHASVTADKLAQLESKLRADVRLAPAAQARLV